MKKNNAFTMAETLLVLVILGIIVTIVMTIFNPLEVLNKTDKLVLEKTILDIDLVTKNVLANETIDGTFDTMVLSNNQDWYCFSNATNTSVKGQCNIDVCNKFRKYLKVKTFYNEPALCQLVLKNNAVILMSFLDYSESSNYFTSNKLKFYYLGDKTPVNVNNAYGFVEIYQNLENKISPMWGKNAVRLPLKSTGIDYNPN